MLNKSIPRIVVSGLRGGSGKTVLSLSLVALLREKGFRITPFKKGPDYIDAGWLAKASGLPCYNLDLFMMSPEQTVESFVSHSYNSQIAIIEGNRGLYDGVDHEGTYSTAELAKLLNAPVVLLIDCTKATNTIAALVLGCQKMDPGVSIQGVVLNRIATDRQESLIKKAITERCNLPVLGAIPRLKKDPFPERYMGLTPFQEHKDTEDSIAFAAEIGAKYLDMDGILRVAENAGTLKTAISAQPSAVSNGQRTTDNKPRIGVIRDSAFQFYYQENFEELEKRGARLIEVSPLKESKLPEIDALYIGGGFPETHAIALAENKRFRDSLYEAVQNRLPVYAECGGLMYLGKSLILEGRTYPMVGALPIIFGLERKPQAHGYTIVEVENTNPYFPPKSVFRGHEFHYSRVLEIEGNGVSMAFNVRRGKGIVDNKDGMCYKNVLAAYTHLHAVGSPEWADGLVRCAERYKEGTEAQRHKGTE
ncbi:MAG TPA: hydrogenobyrinic acid a,c-diamide synthase (glutamine-hydrolyzing) [Nitrospirae bacterium]|nr:cobyrinic acid A,C-diamide synthase [bacterium BMS3Abin06]HDH13418.1 hydrogenobyrinic acid a,c-diamide synthase (glutamine-hydrolyzing) [Nitrospirota bacterium]HDZ02167.1 hydrogenobyrinic acid a,c-diamide synthase (glutamine-hydrolyzing) [Nitrospirota bacterium]